MQWGEWGIQRENQFPKSSVQPWAPALLLLANRHFLSMWIVCISKKDEYSLALLNVSRMNSLKPGLCLTMFLSSTRKKKSWVGRADIIINACDILRRFSNTSPLLGGICTVLKQAQIPSPNVSVLLSAISGPPPGWVKLEVIHWVQCADVRRKCVFPPPAVASCDSQSEPLTWDCLWEEREATALA